MLRGVTCALIAGALSVVGGCQMVGPVAIDQGRDRYNHIIESTSKEQTFSNILRVAHHEPTLFMDVTEVDATTTMSGNASGAITNIGAKQGTSGGTLAGQVGGFSSGATYSESPLIRYQPLLGQSLVVQLATPVSTDALASLYDSSWDPAPLLDLSASFMTRDTDEFYAALNIITELNSAGRLELVAEKSDLSKPKDSSASGKIDTGKGIVTLQVTNKASSGGATDALVIYFLPFHPHAKSAADRKDNDRHRHLWYDLKTIYARSQGAPAKNDVNCAKDKTAGKTDGKNPTNTATLADNKKPAAETSPPAPPDGNSATANPNNTQQEADPDKCFVVDPDRIELRTMPLTPATKVHYNIDSGAPLMKTYSALGILKAATEDPPKIGFVTLDEYRQLREYPWNDAKTIKQNGQPLTFYTLLPPPGEIGAARADVNLDNEISNWLQRPNPNPFIYRPEAFVSDDFVKGNQRMGHLRRYILIIRGSAPPPDAYVAHFDHGEWYYIDSDDEISQRNFDLVSLFTTMMAVPSTTPPLAPTISTGGS